MYQFTLINSIAESHAYFHGQGNLITDAFTRIINDDKRNVVTSCRFYENKHNQSVTSSKIIKLIHLSSNCIDDGLVQRAIDLIKNVCSFQKYNELIKHPSKYIFAFHSMTTLKFLLKKAEQLVNYFYKINKTHTFLEPRIEIELKGLRETIKEADKDMNSDKADKQLTVDALNLVSEFIFTIFYSQAESVHIIFDNKLEPNMITHAFLVFMQAIWDSYSVSVLSKQHFLLNEVEYILAGDQVIKIDYNEPTNKYSNNNKNNLHAELALVQPLNSELEDLLTNYIPFSDYQGISKLCCPFCSHILTCLGYKFRGSHTCIMPSILSWNLPNYLSEKQQLCFSKFLKSIVDNQSDTRVFHTNYHEHFNANDILETYLSCSHLSRDKCPKVKSKFDALMISKGNMLDNIKPFKNDPNSETKYLYHEFEWIFGVHSYFENY